MNNKIIAGIVAVVVIAGAIYFATSKPSNESEVSPTNTQTNTPAPSPAPVASNSKSMQELMANGSSQKCTFEDDNSRGTTYISQGKMRGDFTSTQDGQTMTMHTIMDGQTSYTWMDGQTAGFKMSMSQAASPDQNAPSQGVDVNKKMDYNCTAWTADSASFSLPKGVTFTDYSQMGQ